MEVIKKYFGKFMRAFDAFLKNITEILFRLLEEIPGENFLKLLESMVDFPKSARRKS